MQQADNEIAFERKGRDDDGGGFTPSRLEAPNPLGESGRGLQVLAALVESLDVISVEDTGTLVRFTKRLSWEP